MKAIICHDTGEGLAYRDVHNPIAKSGEIVIAVKAVGVNFADALMVKGRYQLKPPLPFSPGFELAGEVIALADDVDAFAVGQRVMALVDYGAYAEQIAVATERVMALPAGMAFEDAAAFSVAYGTAHLALEHRARLKAGETLLVHGAAGGVGLSAVELGKHLGARVIAAASSEEKCALCLRYGADYVINTQQDDFVTAVKDITKGHGADVIVDPVGGQVLRQSLRCIAWEGRLLVIGFASGEIPEVAANLLLVKNCALLGVFWGAYMRHNAPLLKSSLQQLAAWISQGQLKPHISKTYALAQAEQALSDITQRRVTGKLVLTVA